MSEKAAAFGSNKTQSDYQLIITEKRLNSDRQLINTDNNGNDKTTTVNLIVSVSWMVGQPGVGRKITRN